MRVEEVAGPRRLADKTSSSERPCSLLTQSEPVRLRAALRCSDARIDVVDAGHPLRSAVERYIEARFSLAFGARVTEHFPLLIALFGRAGEVRAACGVRFADDRALFLEQYLDAAVEIALSDALDAEVSRVEIVEIGSLAASSSVAAVSLFAFLTDWLAETQGRTLAVATLRPEVSALLERAGCSLVAIGTASPARLRDGDHDWGAYYERGAFVFAGAIQKGAALGRRPSTSARPVSSELSQ